METVSTEHEMMDASAEAMYSSLGKRKAEEFSGDSESSRESEIEKGGGSSAELTGSGSASPTKIQVEDCGDDDSSKEWEWGYDSFEGREYVSHSENVYSDEESNEKSRRYFKQYFGSKGFYIDPKNIPDVLMMGAIFPMDDEDLDTVCMSLGGKTEREHLEDMAKLALQMYNEKNGTNVIFDHMVRVNLRQCHKVKTYITIMAQESPEGPSVEYQVKLVRKIMGKDTPIFCRPSPKGQDTYL